MSADRAIPRPLADRLAVYLVADPEQTSHDLLGAVATALDHGVTAVQLRAKRLPDRAALALAVALRDLCRPRGALFVVNDRLDLALAAGADGVHLGVQDLPVADARRLAGRDFVIGYSPETEDQTATAAEQGADYVGVGPVFATASKDDAYAPIGPAGVARLARLSRVPAVGIGGITSETAADVVRAGAVGVAVIGAILRAPDVAEATARLAAAVQSAQAPARR